MAAPKKEIDLEFFKNEIKNHSTLKSFCKSIRCNKETVKNFINTNNIHYPFARFNFNTLIGTQINDVLIKDIQGKYAICKCLICGKDNYKTSKQHIHRNRTVQSCGCKNKHGNNSPNWTGYNDVSGSQFISWKCKAKIRNIEFSITIQDIWNLYEKQNKLCPITNEKIYFKKHNVKNQITIDRINNNKGYHLNNIWLTSIDFNYFHFDYTLSEIYKYSKLILTPLKEDGQKITYIPKWHYNSIQRHLQRSKNRILNFSLTENDMLYQFNNQKGICYFTGLPIIIAPRLHGETTASLDRLDSSIGYEPANVVWVHKDINQMKWDMSVDRFKYIANCVVGNPNVLKYMKEETTTSS